MNRILQKTTYLLVGAIILLLSFNRCANTQAGPSGGLKDTIPPVLLKTMPKENTIQFQGKKVVLTFDEYIALKDVSKNVVVSPPSLRRASVQRRGKDIQVVFQDTLMRNRTYTIDFGNALTDNNEGNLFPPYTFVFSTGSVIDTMAFTGLVRDAYTLDPMEKATVVLYENLADSAVYKDLPVAIARTDEWGYFSIRNIPLQSYRLFAIDDKNSNYRYDPGSEKIAFLDSLVIPDKTVSMLPRIENVKDTLALLARPAEMVLLAATENVRKQFLSEYVQPGRRQLRLIFNQYNPEITSFEIEGLDTLDYVVEHSYFRDTLTYWLTASVIPDTIRATLNYLATDSLEQLSPTELKLRFALKEPDDAEKKKEESEEVVYLNPDINFNEQRGMHQGIIVSFNTLPVQIDTTKLTLFNINTEKQTRTEEPFRWVRDTASLCRFYIQGKWATLSGYELEVLPGAFTDIYGLTNDTIVKKITTPNPDKYCHVTLVISGVSSNYILQLLDNKKERILREVKFDTDKKILLDYLPSGEYSVRFIDDENHNGVWDPGIVSGKKQPEKVAFLKFSDNSDKLFLRENLEIEQSVDVIKLFAPEIYMNDHDDHDHEKTPVFENGREHIISKQKDE